MAATWVERHKLNNSLLVFIHGIFGDATNTWRGIPNLLQNDFASDPRICSYDSYLFEYPSTLFNQVPFDPYILDQLDIFLKGLPDKYQTTVLVGHSQGPWFDICPASLSEICLIGQEYRDRKVLG